MKRKKPSQFKLYNKMKNTTRQRAVKHHRLISSFIYTSVVANLTFKIRSDFSFASLKLTILKN